MSKSPTPPPDDPIYDNEVKLPPLKWSLMPEVQTGQSVEPKPEITEEEKRLVLEAVRRALERLRDSSSS